MKYILSTSSMTTPTLTPPVAGHVKRPHSYNPSALVDGMLPLPNVNP